MKTTLVLRFASPLLILSGLLPRAFGQEGGTVPAREQSGAQTTAGSKQQAIDIDYLFQQLDSNGNKMIDRQEWVGLSTILSGISAAQGTKGSNSGAAKGSVSSGSAAALGDRNALYSELDTNHDGLIDRAEFAAIAGKLSNPPKNPLRK